MEMIASFQVDHTQILPGIYVSRVDQIGVEAITTFDIRMKRPNVEPAIHPNAMHTIEHIAATYLRNDDEWKDRIVYWGPMGCLTGSYLIVKGRATPQEVYPLVVRAFKFVRDFVGEVPGATAINCGNFRLHDIAMARFEAATFVQALENDPHFEYKASERSQLKSGQIFYDS